MPSSRKNLQIPGKAKRLTEPFDDCPYLDCPGDTAEENEIEEIITHSFRVSPKFYIKFKNFPSPWWVHMKTTMFYLRPHEPLAIYINNLKKTEQVALLKVAPYFGDLTVQSDRVLGDVFTALRRISQNKYDIIPTDEKMLSCLEPKEWLVGDTVYQYLTLLNQRNPRTIFIDPLLTDRGRLRSIIEETLKLYAGSFHHLLLPICQDLHWTVVVVDMTSDTISHYDSLARGDMELCEQVSKYISLVNEYKDRRFHLIDSPFIPKQKNSYDCGAFMLCYCDLISQGELISKDSFGQDDIPTARRAIGNSLKESVAYYLTFYSNPSKCKILGYTRKENFRFSVMRDDGSIESVNGNDAFQGDRNYQDMIIRYMAECRSNNIIDYYKLIRRVKQAGLLDYLWGFFNQQRNKL